MATYSASPAAKVMRCVLGMQVVDFVAFVRQRRSTSETSIRVRHIQGFWGINKKGKESDIDSLLLEMAEKKNLQPTEKYIFDTGIFQNSNSNVSVHKTINK